MLTVHNRATSAVLVGVTDLHNDSVGRTVIVPPCVGNLVVQPGVDGVPASGAWLVAVMGDRSGRLDQILRDGAAVPTSRPYPADVIIWTSADIGPTTLPVWVTISPAGVVTGTAAPDETDSTDCANPWSEPSPAAVSPKP